MLQNFFSKKLAVLIGLLGFILFGSAIPVFAQQKTAEKTLFVPLEQVFDSTAQQRDPSLDQQLSSASLSKLASYDDNDYETLGYWPGIMRQNEAGFDDHLNFVFSDFNLPLGAQITGLNFYHYFSVNADNAGNVNKWFYNVYDQDNNLLATIDGSVLNADGTRQDTFNLFSLVEDNTRGLKIEFYLFKENETKLFHSNHDYVGLEVVYEEELPQISLLAPVDNALLNSNQPQFVWESSNNTINLYYKLQIWDQNQKLIFDKSIGQISSYNLPIILVDGNYSWQIIFSEDNINWIGQSEIRYFEVDTLAPQAPIINAVVDNNTAAISWGIVEEGLTYEIYRNDLFLGTTNLNYYFDQNLEKGRSYQYYVVAIDKVGNRSLASNIASVYLLNPQISSVSFISGENINIAAPVPTPVPQTPVIADDLPGQVQAESISDQVATNWALVIAIILAGLLMLGGGLYWWYSREEDEI
ncbi:MAG: hypothetical protein PHW50_00990 [Patescibacteria group bacterium]|nr:hypothetical protein [Patescibacteria group bacterium]